MIVAAYSAAMLADMIDGWELLLILAVILILFAAKVLSGVAKELGDGLGEGLGFFKRAVQGYLDELGRDPKFHLPDYRGEPQEKLPMKSSAGTGFVLWVAQGFGVGRIPFAPGTFGTLVGLLWFSLLLLARSYWLFLFYALFGVACAVWICNSAEKILRQTDPGSVVLDEIVAVPLCFAGWAGLLFFQSGQMPTAVSFFGDGVWYKAVAVLAAFRFFDIAKPWPVRQSQLLPGGWGVTMDDVLAAAYVNVAFFAGQAISH